MLMSARGQYPVPGLVQLLVSHLAETSSQVTDSGTTLLMSTCAFQESCVGGAMPVVLCCEETRGQCGALAGSS